MSSFDYLNGVALSAYLGSPNPIQAADTAAGSTGYVYLDASVTLPGNTVLSAKWIGAGGVITRGSYTLSGYFWAPPEIQMFDASGTGRITLVGCSEAWVKWFGAAGDNSTNDANPINQFTAAIRGAGVQGYLNEGKYVVQDATWDCTANGTSQQGLQIRGTGTETCWVYCTQSLANTGIGMDLTGQFQWILEGFVIIGGHSASDCPQVTVLMGAADEDGFLFSGAATHKNMQFNGYGDHVLYNAGAEQISYRDCTGYQSGTTGDFYAFVGAGCVPAITSGIVTTNSPVSSMTDVLWDGAYGAIFYSGQFCIRFLLNQATNGGQVANIFFHRYTQNRYSGGGGSVFMSDDITTAKSQSSIANCGGRDLIIEQGATNTTLAAAIFGSALVRNVEFSGYHGAASLVGPLFRFGFSGAGSTVTNPRINWDIGAGSSFGGLSGYFADLSQADLRGGYIGGNFTTAQINPPPGFTSISGSTQFDHLISADGALRLGSPTFEGPATGGTFSVAYTLRAGNRISAASDSLIAVQTTSAVSTSPTNILVIGGSGNLVGVTGCNGSGSIFADLLWLTNAGFMTIASATDEGSPSARTYGVGSGNLTLSMASGSYAVQATTYGFGTQA